jgi:hypothetical protein
MSIKAIDAEVRVAKRKLEVVLVCVVLIAEAIAAKTPRVVVRVLEIVLIV